MGHKRLNDLRQVQHGGESPEASRKAEACGEVARLVRRTEAASKRPRPPGARPMAAEIVALVDCEPAHELPRLPRHKLVELLEVCGPELHAGVQVT